MTNKVIARIKEKLSDLFINKDELDSLLLDKADITEIPTSISDLINNSQFIEEFNLTDFVNWINTCEVSWDSENGIITIEIGGYELECIVPSIIESETGIESFTAIITNKGEAFVDKNIDLYIDSTLVDTQTTNENGEVIFSINFTESTVYTIKFQKEELATVTAKKLTVLFQDTCTPCEDISIYLKSGSAQLYQESYGLRTRSANNGGTMRIPIELNSNMDWEMRYNLVQSSNSPKNIWGFNFYLSNTSITNDGALYFAYVRETSSQNYGHFILVVNGVSMATTDNYDVIADAPIVVKKTGTVLQLYYNNELVIEYGGELPELSGYIGAKCTNTNENNRTFKNLKLISL